MRLVKLNFLPHDVFNAGFDLAECMAHVVTRIKVIASLVSIGILALIDT